MSADNLGLLLYMALKGYINDLYFQQWCYVRICVMKELLCHYTYILKIDKNDEYPQVWGLITQLSAGNFGLLLYMALEAYINDLYI